MPSGAPEGRIRLPVYVSPVQAASGVLSHSARRQKPPPPHRHQRLQQRDARPSPAGGARQPSRPLAATTARNAPRSGTIVRMALTGPQYFREAASLVDKARHERNTAEKTRLLEEAQVNATLALVAATVYSGNVSKDDQKVWWQHGVRT